ncbi:dihydrofolate reductase family protein [Amycolatopsis sp. NPDC098790]|uniref:dihydrofolate reductase family protein n=1 Tax=Amycolatopsis sp. NPDC098790 TaxID=3363939 RepID=UPI00380D72D8
MATVIADVSMSLDGFIANLDDSVGPLFDWFQNGHVDVPSKDPRWQYKTTEASAEHLREGFVKVKSLICGRTLFDYAHGWGGNHPAGVPLFVVTHSVPDGWPREDSPYSFVTDGVESAVKQASEVAGDDGWVAIASASIAQQCLNAGLLDGLRISLVPVLFGEGVPLLANLTGRHTMLSDPIVREGKEVTHLHYTVLK